MDVNKQVDRVLYKTAAIHALRKIYCVELIYIQRQASYITALIIHIICRI